MYAGNSSVVNILMRWPVLIPVVATAAIVPTVTDKKEVPTPAPVVTPAPAPAVVVPPAPVTPPVVPPPAPPKKIKG